MRLYSMVLIRPQGTESAACWWFYLADMYVAFDDSSGDVALSRSQATGQYDWTILFLVRFPLLSWVALWMRCTHPCRSLVFTGFVKTFTCRGQLVEEGEAAENRARQQARPQAHP